MSDEQLHRATLNFASQHGVDYEEALRCVQLEQRLGMSAAQARVAFAEGGLPGDEQIADFAELESIKRRIPFEDALEIAIGRIAHGAGAKNFYEAVHWGIKPSDSDIADAATLMAEGGEVSFAEALGHLGRMLEFGDTSKALEIAFSEGREVTDGMVHSAALARQARTGASYLDALHYVGETLSRRVGANFAEAAAAADPAQGVELEIFRAGTHTDSAGRRHTFSVDDVRKTAAAYDKSKREAPMVKGHPGDDAPAYGWIASLRATEDGRLMARATQWDEGFQNELKAGRYKKRSASFYPPDHPNNPVPGVMYLRHLGWLGAHQPALAGLPDASFTAPAEGCVSFTL